MAEEPNPQEETQEPDEKEPGEKEPEVGGPGGGPQPNTPHWPIDCVVTNLHHLDAVAFQRRTGRPLGDYGGSTNEGIGGTQFLVTLTLAVPVTFPSPPFTVDVKYIALHDGIQKTSGLFLYKQTDSVTFRADTPDRGSQTQQFILQTIRFTSELMSSDAEITIEPHYKGAYVGKRECRFTLRHGL